MQIATITASSSAPKGLGFEGSDGNHIWVFCISQRKIKFSSKQPNAFNHTYTHTPATINSLVHHYITLVINCAQFQANRTRKSIARIQSSCCGAAARGAARLLRWNIDTNPYE